MIYYVVSSCRQKDRYAAAQQSACLPSPWGESGASVSPFFLSCSSLCKAGGLQLTIGVVALHQLGEGDIWRTQSRAEGVHSCQILLDLIIVAAFFRVR